MPGSEKDSEKKEHEFEEIIICWKNAMKKCDYIMKYIDHWYKNDEGKIWIYVVVEYCPGGKLAEEIFKRKKENKKFTEEVFFLL